MRRYLLFMILLLGLAAREGAAQSGVAEYDLKASFLYNFAVFAEWPHKTEGNLNLCVLGQDNFGPALKRLESKSVRGMAIVVARLSSLAAIRKCDLLFIAEREVANMRQILAELGDSPVLTVSETPGAYRGIITLSNDGARLAFEIDQTRARQLNLKLSSKLLQLARTVY